MTRVDFYILPAQDIQARQLFACRLIEKAYRMGHRIYIHTNDEHQSQALDELLWSYRPSSFIPHAQLGVTAKDERPSIEIGHGEHADDHHDVLINLSQQVPQFFSSFERVTEVVVQDQQVLNATRQNYKFYKDRGYPLERHDMRNSRTAS